jgi:hypothetical protein
MGFNNLKKKLHGVLVDAQLTHMTHHIKWGAPMDVVGITAKTNIMKCILNIVL